MYCSYVTGNTVKSNTRIEGSCCTGASFAQYVAVLATEQAVPM